jgi:hypothetical protein
MDAGNSLDADDMQPQNITENLNRVSVGNRIASGRVAFREEERKSNQNRSS